MVNKRGYTIPPAPGIAWDYGLAFPCCFSYCHMGVLLPGRNCQRIIGAGRRVQSAGRRGVDAYRMGVGKLRVESYEFRGVVPPAAEF